MEANETIGKWAVEKGLLDCWHNFEWITYAQSETCTVCRKQAGMSTSAMNPDYSIYESLAPVLDKLFTLGWHVETLIGNPEKLVMIIKCDGSTFEPSVAFKSFTNLPTTLRDMVAELISKGEV